MPSAGSSTRPALPDVRHGRYARQIIALAWASYIREVIGNVVVVVDREFLLPAKDLISHKQSLGAAIWLQRAVEACHKAKDRIEALEESYIELKKLQIAELKWAPSGAEAALATVEAHRVEIVRLLATLVPELVDMPSDLPDVVGPARAWIANELVAMMEHKQEPGFRELFGAYMAASLARYDHLTAQMRTTGSDYYGRVAMNTLLDVMDISGLAIIYSELDGTSFAKHTKATWGHFLSLTADVPQTIKTSFLAIDMKLLGPIFSASAMQRQEWNRRLGEALVNRGVDLERDFEPFSAPEESHRHASAVVESISVLYGRPMTEPHNYFAGLYLAARPEAAGLELPHTVKDTIISIERAQADDETSDPQAKA